MSGKLVVGRVVVENGMTSVVPVNHGQGALKYQQNVADLIKAAREYAADPRWGTLTELKKAAYELAKEQHT